MKKFLLSLFVGFVGIISFCSAGTFTIEGNVNNGFDTIMNIPQRTFGTNFTVHCVFDASYLTCQGGNAFSFVFNYGKVYSSNMNSTTTIDTNTSYSMRCDNPNNVVVDFDFSTVLPGGGPYGEFYGVTYIKFNNLWTVGNQNIPYSCTFVGNNILDSGGGSCPECPTCPEINTGEILSGYILESEIDTNYCVGNGLCPNECGSGTDLSGDLQYSNLYINSILHPGEENIFIDIPDYIQWDYSVTTGEFNIYVGSGYDMDYMNSIIKINSYRPDSTDFTDVFVSGLTLIFPYIFVVLLLMFIWKLLKRIFK